MSATARNLSSKLIVPILNFELARLFFIEDFFQRLVLFGADLKLMLVLFHENFCFDFKSPSFFIVDRNFAVIRGI